MIDIEATTSECIDLAEEEDDKMTKYFLEKFLYEQVRNYTKLALNFVDYVEKNGDEPVRHLSMDARINKFLNMPTLSVGEDDD
jgi:ferritin